VVKERDYGIVDFKETNLQEANLREVSIEGAYPKGDNLIVAHYLTFDQFSKMKNLRIQN
jgi:uncharacterized protein YjbI with pentapeptide repeats